MSDNQFLKVKDFILELGYHITREDAEDAVFVISDEESGINNLVIGVSDPLVIIEQYIFTIKQESFDLYKSLLRKNRDIIHGAFALDDSGKKVLFRDTLQLENLDLNELEGSINSLALLLSEYSDELLSFTHN
ncbi:molecular chaperone Tir [bacterium]|nr:molecular chaperone Tir [bacterium]